jgi:hypothetical protein
MLGIAVLLERYRKREITYRRANRPNPAIHVSNLFILGESSGIKELLPFGGLAHKPVEKDFISHLI